MSLRQRLFYSPFQKLQEGGASWDSCACSRHSCLLDRGLNNRLKLECNRLKWNITYGSSRLTDNPLLQVSADLQRIAAISNHLISTMASYLRWEPEPQVKFFWKSWLSTFPADFDTPLIIEEKQKTLMSGLDLDINLCQDLMSGSHVAIRWAFFSWISRVSC